MTRLDEYAADIVRRMPHPPREISPGTVIWHLSAMTETRWVVGLGVILMLPVTIWTAWSDVSERELWAKVVALVIMVPTTTFIVGNPVIGGVRLARDLASGITLRAQILESEWQPPQAFPPTFGAAAHGLTRGRRRVFHPAGDFEQPFESDSTWARDLTPGTYVSLLAHPTARRVYFDLGPPTRQRPAAVDRVAIDRS